MYGCVRIEVCAHDCWCPWKPEEDTSSWELELQMIGKQPTLVLGTKLKSPGKSRKFSTTGLFFHPSD